MLGKYLLDTSVLVALLRGDRVIARRLEEEDNIYTSSIAFGELYFGAEKAARSQLQRDKIAEISAQCVVLVCDIQTAQIYGDFKNQLRLVGKPIPENDLWIAATAHQHGLTLAHRDKHFAELKALSIEAW